MLPSGPSRVCGPPRAPRHKVYTHGEVQQQRRGSCFKKQQFRSISQQSDGLSGKTRRNINLFIIEKSVIPDSLKIGTAFAECQDPNDLRSENLSAVIVRVRCMNDTTISLALIASLKARIARGLHLNVLFIINEYLASDPLMARALASYLTDDASRSAPYKHRLLSTYLGKTLTELDHEERERVRELLSFEQDGRKETYKPYSHIPTSRGPYSQRLLERKSPHRVSPLGRRSHRKALPLNRPRLAESVFLTRGELLASGLRRTDWISETDHGTTTRSIRKHLQLQAT